MLCFFFTYFQKKSAGINWIKIFTTGGSGAHTTFVQRGCQNLQKKKKISRSCLKKCGMCSEDITDSWYLIIR